MGRKNLIFFPIAEETKTKILIFLSTLNFLVRQQQHQFKHVSGSAIAWFVRARSHIVLGSREKGDGKVKN